MSKAEIFLLIADASVLIMIIDQVLLMSCNIKAKDHYRGDLGSYVMFCTIAAFLYFYNGRFFGFIGKKITPENTTVEWIVVTTIIFIGINIGLAINKYEVKKHHVISDNPKTLAKWELIAQNWLNRIKKQQLKTKGHYYGDMEYHGKVIALMAFVILLFIFLFVL
jgi:hypothetical protein